jgi:FkbM family methyltransferase
MGGGRIVRVRRATRRWWHRRRAIATETLRTWIWSPRPMRLDYSPQDIWLNVTSDEERRYRVRNPDKEPWTIEWLRTYIRRDEVLYDVGANVGVFSLIAALHLHARVFAFEPGFANYARLCENIHLNGCAKTITPLPWLLADKTGVFPFEYRSLSPGQSRHVMLEGAASPEADAGLVYVQPMTGVSLDAAIDLFSFPAPNHIKLDVDGAEALVLEGAARTLARPELRSVLVEANADTGQDVTSRLVHAGLQLAKTHTRDKAGAPWYGVFERTSVRS